MGWSSTINTRRLLSLAVLPCGLWTVLNRLGPRLIALLLGEALQPSCNTPRKQKSPTRNVKPRGLKLRRAPSVLEACGSVPHDLLPRDTHTTHAYRSVVPTRNSHRPRRCERDNT